MSENSKVIDGVNVTSTDIKCPGCGATIGIKFDPASTTLKCPFCGLLSQLPVPGPDTVAAELDFNSALQHAKIDWGYAKKLIICSNCGGQTLYDAEQVTGACPFCGSTSVTAVEENGKIMTPNAVIPFSISKEMTQQCFISFLQRKRCLNKKALNCKLENIVGIYLPFWTFDTLTVSSFYATDVNAESSSEKIKGVWSQFFDDIIIFASDRVCHPYISKVQKFDFEKAVPYSPKYLAGIPAERYTVDLNEGWERAKKLIRPKIITDMRRQQRYLVSKLDSNYYNVKFRCLLAPVYLATYRFGKKTLQVAINGQTGETFCEAPTRIRMIILLAFLGLLLASGIEVLILWLLSGYI